MGINGQNQFDPLIPRIGYLVVSFYSVITSVFQQNNHDTRRTIDS